MRHIFKLTKLLFFLLPFGFGLFYEWTSCIAGLIFTGLLIWTAISQKTLKIPCGISAFCLSAIVLLYLISSIYAVDSGMAVLGFMKFLPVLIFSVLTAQFEDEEKRELLNTLPYSTCAMTLLSFVFYFTPWKQYFYRAERLGGFFQYSNTYALILFLGIIILLFERRKTKADLAAIAVLAMGILMSGSRSVFLFAFFTFLVAGIKTLLNKARDERQQKKQSKTKGRREIAPAAAVLIVITASVILAAVTGNVQLFARFSSISFNSSTLIGRLLYYQDAVAMLLRRPYGLGYMGYRYLCGSEQTGVYQIQYVHNDFLQIGLDIGIVGMVVFLLLFFCQMFSKRNLALQKTIGMIIILHSFIDFDMQFLFVDLILVLCMDLRKIKHSKRIRPVIISAFFIPIGIFGYMLLPLFQEYAGCHTQACAIYPYYTEAKVNEMLDETDKDLQNKIAVQIAAQNKYCSDAYYVMAIYHVNNGDYDEMIQNQKHLIQLEKYTIENYEQYIKMLSVALEAAADKEDKEKMQEYVGYVLEVPQMLEEVQKNTSSLAYRINDKPNLKLNQAYEEYIASLRKMAELF